MAQGVGNPPREELHHVRIGDLGEVVSPGRGWGSEGQKAVLTLEPVRKPTPPVPNQ